MVQFQVSKMWVLLNVLTVFLPILSNGELTSRRFPKGFRFGAATASYQIEGGWNTSDKSENIWDRLTHAKPWMIEDNSNGDIACDSYHKYKEDVQLLKDIGVDYYRFSISWTRLLPNGFNNQISRDGVTYYNNLIDELVANGVDPVVTLYHWDLPQALQDLGGWANPNMAQYFEGYAKTVFQLFGDRVKIWITINEPFEVCQGGYGVTRRAPALHFSGVADYLCGHTVLKAHAAVYRLYNQTFRQLQQGKISLALSADWYEPVNETKEIVALAERAIQFELGWFAHPIFSAEGDYPPVMKERVARMSREQGFSQSRLPLFTEQEISYIRGTFDYFGFNHYTSQMVGAELPRQVGLMSFEQDVGLEFFPNPNWKETDSADWMKVNPPGFANLLKWIKEEYNNPEVMVMENGYPDSGSLQDLDRIDYLRGYVRAMLDAMEGGCNVTAYTVWSLLDNFEWRTGYTGHFGLVSVDFSSPERSRQPKASAGFLKTVIRDGLI